MILRLIGLLVTWTSLRLAIALLWWAASSFPADASPTNVLLVVNPKSVTSMTVANHYVALRDIPSANVVYLSWEPGKHRTDVDTFRREILAPVLREAFDPGRRRGRIDYVVYSTDFPWAIDLKPDFARFRQARDDAGLEAKVPKQFTPVGSITGLTYLWQAVIRKDLAYPRLHSNHYMQSLEIEDVDLPTRPFSSATRWDVDGNPVEDQEQNKATGRRYLLSVMLGVTAEYGNTEAEIVSYLRRSAAADGDQPGGTIYLMRNGDIRSKVRQGSYYTTALQLKRLGVEAEIVDGKLPQQRPDVQGLVTGTATFDWEDCGSRIRPGAICEHLTSFGGVLDRAGQTKLSAFLRYGAAGSSGTVTEPYAIAQKFPDPVIQLHYARGCSLAEAYYQSVAGPYQLLIVGDPLCRPWGRWPQIALQGIFMTDELSGEYRIRPAVTFPDGESLDRVDFFVDGKYQGRFPAGEAIPLDTTELADGHHRLRFVVTDTTGRVEGHQTALVSTNNHQRRILIESQPDDVHPADRPVLLEVRSPGSIGIAVMHNGRLIDRITGDRGTLRIDPAKLGHGPVALRVIGLGTGGPETSVIARPVEFNFQ